LILLDNVSSGLDAVAFRAPEGGAQEGMGHGLAGEGDLELVLNPTYYERHKKSRILLALRQAPSGDED
jgi:hypothetical protein